MSPEAIASLVRVLGARAEVLDGYLFGSAARGDTHPNSAVDVAVYVDPALVPDTPFGYAWRRRSEVLSVAPTSMSSSSTRRPRSSIIG